MDPARATFSLISYRSEKEFFIKWPKDVQMFTCKHKRELDEWLQAIVPMTNVNSGTPSLTFDYFLVLCNLWMQISLWYSGGGPCREG